MAIYMWRDVQIPYLCFTANTAGSTISLNKSGSPATVTLETSTDGSTWSTYTFGNTITLSNIGDKVYWRNTSETPTQFSTADADRYQFSMSGSIAGSGNCNTLLCKYGTDTLVSNYCFDRLFQGCSSLTTSPTLSATTLTTSCYKFMFLQCSNLTTAPKLPATTLKQECYYGMFHSCSNLEILPELPATTLPDACYANMFVNCKKIKLSTTQTGEYQTAYRIPKNGTGSVGSDSLTNTFYGTGGTFTGTPSINTTYYTSNQVI